MASGLLSLAQAQQGLSTSDQQFLGRSDQDLKIFVLNLKDGTNAGTPSGMPTIANAFAGSMLNVTHDADKELDYQDDVVYIPYVRKDATAGTWTQGGVLRLSTNESTNVGAWTVSTVMDGIGPVTSSVVKLQHTRKGRLWLYFGTGRYYFEQSATVDDADSQRKLYGVLEPCFTHLAFLTRTCTDSITGSLTDVTVMHQQIQAPFQARRLVYQPRCLGSYILDSTKLQGGKGDY